MKAMQLLSYYQNKPKTIFTFFAIVLLLAVVVLSSTIYQRNQNLRSRAAEALQSQGHEVEDASLINGASAVQDGSASNGSYVLFP